MKLEELADITSGIPTTKDDLSATAGERYRLVKIKHLLGGVLAPSKDLEAIYLTPPREPSKFALKAGDIIVAMLGANPQLVHITTTPRRCVADRNLAIVRPRSP